MHSWLRRATTSGIGPLVLVLLTILAVVTMHALDHTVAHQSSGESGAHDAHRDGDSGAETGGSRHVASPVAAACGFILLAPALRIPPRCGALRYRSVVDDGAASQVFVGPEPPVPRTLFVV